MAPELVVFDEGGKPQAVRYHFVNAMLLSEVQEQERLITDHRREIEELRTRLGRLEALLGTPRPN